MPIQIVNSGVKLGSEPNTSTTVVFRNEGGVVCRRLSNNQRNKTNHLSQGSLDASDGGTALSAIDRHTTLTVAHPGDGEGGSVSSPYDMTSVFGLKVRNRSSTYHRCRQTTHVCGYLYLYLYEVVNTYRLNDTMREVSESLHHHHAGVGLSSLV